jgi:cytoskeletal protein CcmA (bactofilin family)
VWNKKEESDTRLPVEPVRNAPAPQSSMPMPAANTRPAAPPPTAIIGAAMRIKGEIRSGEELLVDGEVEGSMESQSLLTWAQMAR